MSGPHSSADTGGDSAALPVLVSCPFHDGPETLDLLLAELRHQTAELVDLALELRSAMTAQPDAEHSLRTLFALRARLDGRHHLAFYRVRCWVRRRVVAEVRAHRAADWIPCPLPPACARYDELVNGCLATLADASRSWPPTASMRVRFATEVTPAR